MCIADVDSPYDKFQPQVESGGGVGASDGMSVFKNVQGHGCDGYRIRHALSAGSCGCGCVQSQDRVQKEEVVDGMGKECDPVGVGGVIVIADEGVSVIVQPKG